jgi:NAD(P)-dependent dehydrogenase (short-subunit alcohol dehydrogenase family)
MGTMEKLEEYLEALEEYVFTSFTSATPDGLRETVNQLWLDITRYGPNIPNIHDVRIPGLGDFEIPPPPPPPSPKMWSEKCHDWVDMHPWAAGGIVVGAVGAGLLVGYGRIYMRTTRARSLKKRAEASERRQVIVVLGGDTPFGLPLILDLEKKGYIVITSVATSEAADALERSCRGYVRALVLDPSQPDSVPLFLRSLASTLSRRFPITAAGDPYASPASHPYIQSVVSLLTLPPPSLHAPLEHVSLQHSYISYLNVTQITPLQVIQSLLPLLRNAHVPNHGKKTIVVCLPATESHMGLPFSAIQSMSAASTERALEVLRREINVAALTGKSETMKNIKVVVADVGAFDLGGESSPQDVYKAMEKWTASEKVTYGPAFVSMAHQGASVASISSGRSWMTILHGQGVARKPTDVSVFVDTIVGVVSNGKYGYSSIVRRIGLGKLLRWIRGDRLSIGAGAKTYRVASLLPSLILNTLLNIPAFLISIRNSLLTTQPFIRPPASTPAPAPLPPSVQTQATPTPGVQKNPESSGESTNENSEAGSEADVESNEGEDHGLADSSWISLPKEHLLA